MTKIRFTGKPRQVQFESRWLVPDEVLDVPQAIADSFDTLPHFELVEKPRKRRGSPVRASSEKPIPEGQPDWVEPSKAEDPSDTGKE